MPSAGGSSAGYPLSRLVFTTSFCPLGLHLSTRRPLNTTMLNSRWFLDRLWLGPRWHAIQQHLFERPDAVSQTRRHRRRARPPHLGRAPARGWNGLRQCLAQAEMRQDEVVIDLEQRQLIQQAVFALAQDVDPTPDRRHPLTDVEVEPLDKRRVDGPAIGRQDLLDGQLG